MEVNVIRIRPLVKVLVRIAEALDRLADASEARALHDFDYHRRPKAKLSEDERMAEVAYTDEELDAVRELRERLGQRTHDESDEEVL